MKPAIKIGSLLLAVMMVFSVVLSGCTLNKEWSYKTEEKELAIGVYIYALDTAYNKAKTYAEKLDDYDSTKDSWLDMEITDDDGNTAVAREWIKDQAEKECLKYLAVEYGLKQEGATVDSATLQAAEEQSKSYWEVGPYASYGYIQPMSDELEKYGISYESFAYCTGEYSANYSALFAALYAEGGSQAVSDDELIKFINENYADYTYFSIPLTESTTDEASGEEKTVALSDEAAKKITDQLEGYVSDINGGKSYDDVISAYMEASGLTDDPSTPNTEFAEDFSAGDELKAAYDKLENNKAVMVKVGEGDTATAYLLYKKDITATSAEYLEQNRASVLSKMKTDDFDKYLDEIIEKLDYEKSSAVDGYDPKMFFEPVEPTTAADEASGDDSDSGEGDAEE